MTAALKSHELAEPPAQQSLRVQRFVSHPSKLVTDSLGFRLELSITVEDMDGRGQHKTYEQEGCVTPDAIHKIIINANLRDDELAEVIAHEAYHLFYSVRHLIAVDEETETVIFGQLVKHIHATARMANAESSHAGPVTPGLG
jgi:hypothetical protein